jgi:hypothetical protein
MMLISTNYPYLFMRTAKLCKYLDEFNPSKDKDTELQQECKCTTSIAITVKPLAVSRYSESTAAEHKHTLTL